MENASSVKKRLSNRKSFVERKGKFDSFTKAIKSKSHQKQ